MADAKTEEKKTETKGEKFVRLAKMRVNAALDKIAPIGGLSAKGNYEYTPEQVSKMFAAIRAEVDKAEAKFTSNAPAANEGFSFE